MELIIQWFWVVKLFLALFTIYVVYKAAIQYLFKSKFWNIAAVIAVLLAFIQPVKMDVQTKTTTDYANQQIKSNKVLPPKVTDNSFSQSQKLDGITKEDLK